jgi:hypothetical protein
MQEACLLSIRNGNFQVDNCFGDEDLKNRHEDLGTLQDAIYL